MLVRTAGGAARTLDALRQRGYRPGSVMVRMKQGELPEYDAREGFYLDSWL